MRTLVVDSSASLREKLIGLIAEIPGLEIVGEASTWHETIRLLQDLGPDTIILDTHVLESPEIQSIQHLKSSYPQLHVILLSMVFTPEYAYTYRKAGADYVIDKSLGFDRIPGILIALGKR
jgi:DNA-binding NarL/FixJ family response regulator